MAASIQFDGTELANTTYVPRFAKHESAPERELSAVPRARDDGDVFISERYGKKVIALQGILTGSSQADLESKIDAFKELFSRAEKNLDIDWNGSTRRYVATCTNHAFDRDHFNLRFCPWTAEFTVSSGEGKDTGTTTAVNAATVAYDPTLEPSTGTASITFAGSKPPLPTITLAASFGSAARGIEYKNTDTGERIIAEYPGSWGSTRTITLDFQNRTVTGNVVDGVTRNLNMYGVFPRWAIGTNNIMIRAGGITNQKSADNSAADLSNSQVIISSTSDRKAQSFVVPYTSQTFAGIEIYASKTGTPGTLRWEIQTDNNGAPSGTLVDATNSKGTLSVSTTPGYVYAETTSLSPFTLNANTVYWLVLKADSTLDGSNFYTLYLSGDGTNANLGTATYPRGRARYSTDAAVSWTDFTLKTDLSFKICFGGRRATTNFTHTVTYTKTYL